MSKKASIKVYDSPKQIIQSYLFATARREIGIYGERVLLKLIEMAQCDILGMELNGDTGQVTPSLEYNRLMIDSRGNAIVTVPIRELMEEEDTTNYTYVWNSLKELQKQVVCWHDLKRDDNGNVVLNRKGKPIRKWTSVCFLKKIVGEEDYAGIVQFEVDVDIWRAILDFSKGFRKVDLRVTARLEGHRALRFYQLMAYQKEPLTYTLDELRNMFQFTGNQYIYPSTFKNSVLDPAKAELDMKSPWSFTYKIVTENKVTRVTLFPVHNLALDDPQTFNGFDKVHMMLDKKITDMLKKNFEFDEAGLKGTYSIFYAAQEAMTGADFEHPTLFQFLNFLMFGASSAANKAGYAVSAVKQHLEQVYGIVFKSKTELAADRKVEKANARAARKRPKNF